MTLLSCRKVWGQRHTFLNSRMTQHGADSPGNLGLRQVKLHTPPLDVLTDGLRAGWRRADTGLPCP
jgi:hypothetical protein